MFDDLEKIEKDKELLDAVHKIVSVFGGNIVEAEKAVFFNPAVTLKAAELKFTKNNLNIADKAEEGEQYSSVDFDNDDNAKQKEEPKYPDPKMAEFDLNGDGVLDPTEYRNYEQDLAEEDKYQQVDGLFCVSDVPPGQSGTLPVPTGLVAGIAKTAIKVV